MVRRSFLAYYGTGEQDISDPDIRVDRAAPSEGYHCFGSIVLKALERATDPGRLCGWSHDGYAIDGHEPPVLVGGFGIAGGAQMLQAPVHFIIAKNTENDGFGDRRTSGCRLSTEVAAPHDFSLTSDCNHGVVGALVGEEMGARNLFRRV